MSVNTTDPMIGRLVDGRYQVRSRIARGGMATVYLATDLRLERRVAVKVMHGHLADDTAFKQRFIQEARSAARLAHPNVVNVFDQGQDEDHAYLVMEYLPGITLRELLQDYGSLTAEQTIDIAEAVLSGLAAAHKAGIVHRDLKPENVLLADDGRIKIGDFGLARAASANTATGAALLGTIAYLSPELVTRGVADTRSDIYAVGIMMYEMLTGEQPFTGEQPMQIAYQHANDTVPSPSAANPQVPAELDELVLWATARDPEDRPGDARELLDQLYATESLLRAAGTDAPTAVHRTMVLPSAPAPAPAAATEVLTPARTAPPPDDTGDATTALARVARSRRRRGPWLAVALLLLTALAAGTGWYFGAGPGAHSTIPAGVVGATPDEAAQILRELGLEVAEATGEQYDTEIPAGAVATTDPGPGTSIRHGSEVTLVLSQGPEPVEVPALAGEPLETVRSILADLDIGIADPIDERFHAEIPDDVVIAATRADDPEANLSEGGEYLRGGEVALVVSAGPLPAIANESVETATSKLADAGVTVDTGQRIDSYSDEIDEGRVIGLAEPDAVVRPGDSVGLNVSRGPQPVEVPGVIGMTWTEAKPILEDAGFRLDYNPFADAAPSLFRVTRVDPEPGTSVPKGSRLEIRFET